LLVRLAESLGWKVAHHEPPYIYQDNEGDWYLSGGLADWEGCTHKGVVALLVLPADITPMEALRDLVDHLGMLYGICRAVGLEPVAGEWPVLCYKANHRAWMMECRGERRWFTSFELPHQSTHVPALAGITCPYEAAKVIYAEVTGG
jgi:hypothetical protein